MSGPTSTESGESTGADGRSGEGPDRRRAERHPTFQLASELWKEKVERLRKDREGLRNDRLHEDGIDIWEFISEFEAYARQKDGKDHDRLRSKYGEPGDRILDE